MLWACPVLGIVKVVKQSVVITGSGLGIVSESHIKGPTLLFVVFVDFADLSIEKVKAILIYILDIHRLFFQVQLHRGKRSFIVVSESKRGRRGTYHTILE